MKLREILHSLPEELIETLARDRLSQVTDIRLPKGVLIDELAEVLASSAYINSQVAFRHPPCFEILDLLLNSTEHAIPAEGFRQKVEESTERLVQMASRSPIFPKPKNYDLYLRLLYEAWDFQQDIDSSEANLLRALRNELDISLMEHFVVEHHPLLHRFWRNDQAYELERNHLRSAGVLFTVDNRYLIADETAMLVRKAWGAELSAAQFGRLLNVLSNEDLRRILEAEGLNVSGPSDEKKNRIVENYVSPRTALESLKIEAIRESSKALGCRSSGSKDDVIDAIIDWLDDDEDLKAQAAAAAFAAEEAEKQVIPVTTETRILSAEAFADLLGRLTNDALYDILSRLTGLRRSGSKEERVRRLLDSPYSEHRILSRLNNEALHELCRQLTLSPYGPKEEKIGRLMQAYRSFTTQSGVLAFQLANSQLSDSSLPDSTGTTTASSTKAPELQLPRLSAIRSEYPFLSEAEQVILSYLMDFKSVTDPELEKLVQRFSLPWILPKAQMEEMLHHLSEQGRIVIRVRGIGDHNIYELL
ncbi:hypothetical protein L0222_27725 [bacterium]|nr:hypothetical protein [bacterium]